MNMEKLLQKLSSRKFWLAAAGVATGIAMALGVDSGDVTAVAGAVTALVSVVTYVITEGRVDAEGVKKAVLSVQEAIKVVENCTDAGQLAPLMKAMGERAAALEIAAPGIEQVKS